MEQCDSVSLIVGGTMFTIGKELLLKCEVFSSMMSDILKIGGKDTDTLRSVVKAPLAHPFRTKERLFT